MQIVDTLKPANQADHRLVLLHFHLGSQISHISTTQAGGQGTGADLRRTDQLGLPIRYIDVGGGLGVNYTGAFEEGSIQYSLQEYANAVVSAIQDVCDAREVPHPILMSESGRAMTAHHSVLVVETLGAFRKANADREQALPPDTHRLALNLDDILKGLSNTTEEDAVVDELIEAYHDVVEIHQEASTLFAMGYLPLQQNALIERMYWSSCSAILRLLRAVAPGSAAAAELYDLQTLLVDQYLIDFSVFQSALDHWAIDQPFPIVPLDRLDERPTRRACWST